MNIGVRSQRSVPQPFRDLLFQAKVNCRLRRITAAFVRCMSQDGYVDNNALDTRPAPSGRANPFGHRNDQNL